MGCIGFIIILIGCCFVNWVIIGIGCVFVFIGQFKKEQKRRDNFKKHRETLIEWIVTITFIAILFSIILSIFK